MAQKDSSGSPELRQLLKKMFLFLPLADSRTLGYEAKLRSGSDVWTNTVILPDPLQKALASGTIKGWQVGKYATYFVQCHTKTSLMTFVVV